ncbi:MAG: TonB family protein [Prolixibacteraceae bacterium]|nr:TonB family protein [Prolixibacteraceae bacterium]
MEALATYLIKSSVWLTGFALVYALFLRNERFFVLNRIYLVSGILVSIIFPLFTWHYTVVLPVVPTSEVFEPQIQGIAEVNEPFLTQNVLLLFMYISGIAYLIFRILRQTLPVFHIIRKSEVLQHSSAKLIRTAEYPASFSFFSFVFVNPSISDTETNEIVNHEMEHVRQQHWIDLLLFEILRTMQWFNPAIWLYGHLIRQNHEYLADERALQRSSNPAIYRAALLNQMFGGPVISLANSFNYSLNKKRFTMMKQTISSPIRKLRLLLVLPLIAGVFYAFAAPEYKFVQAEELAANATQNEKTIKGKVSDEKGKPLKSASVVILGKTIGTMTDDNGNFMLKVTDDSPIMISYVGFESAKVNPDFEKEMKIILKGATISIKLNNQAPAAAKEEPIDLMKSNALIIIDGKETTKAELEKINPNNIDRVDVLKNRTSVEKYGEKGKDGVVLITLKSDKQNSETYKIQADGPLKFVTVDGSGKEPLYVKDGIVAESKDVQNLDPETIESISVLKDESATILYGDKGKNGVVLISMKKGKAGTGNNSEEVQVIGYGKMQKDNSPEQSNSGFRIRSTGTGPDPKPLIVIDGVIAENQNVNDIPYETIESVNVLKGESATSIYGEKGKNGVILITIKKEVSTSQNGTSDVVVVGYGKMQNQNSAEHSSSEFRIRSAETGNKPLIVKDGVISENLKIESIDPETILLINVLKNESAAAKYGEKGKNGVLEITTKKTGDVFTMVEEMPQFPGGTEALKTFVYSSLKYPTIALENGIQGQVFVKFVVDKTGKVTNAKVSRGVDPSLDKEAKRIVESMPKWSPGKQQGENVDVTYEMPINFVLPGDYHPKSNEKLRATANSYTKNNKTLKLSIFPNPTSDNTRITLVGSESTNKLEISIYDSTGKLIRKESKNSSTFSLSINKLPPGTYLVVGLDSENQNKVSSQLVVNQ